MFTIICLPPVYCRAAVAGRLLPGAGHHHGGDLRHPVRQRLHAEPVRHAGRPAAALLQSGRPLHEPPAVASRLLGHHAGGAATALRHGHCHHLRSRQGDGRSLAGCVFLTLFICMKLWMQMRRVASKQTNIGVPWFDFHPAQYSWQFRFSANILYIIVSLPKYIRCIVCIM